MIPVTIAVPENKLMFFKELVNSLNFKEIGNSSITDITEEQKQMVLERIKNSNPENWKAWDDVRDNFKLD